MTNATEKPPVAESVPVQLTRMEGNLNLVLFQITDISRRTANLEVFVSELKATTQRLDLDANARDKTAVALALALKEAKDTVEAAARTKANEQTAEAEASNRRWTPWQRIVTVATLFFGSGGILALYLALHP